MQFKTSFPPLINCQAKILILGTLPGEDSLRFQQYYGHKRNHFWRLIGDITEITPLRTPPPTHLRLIEKTYEQKCDWLASHYIALWDTLRCATRKGSLDSNIREPKYNDIPALLKNYPSLQAIAFNGKQARKFFKHHQDKINPAIVLCDLPSSSPAYTLAYEKKLTLWKNAIAPIIYP